MAELIDQRIGWYRESLIRMEACAAEEHAAAGADFVRGLGQAVYRAAAEYLEQNRAALLARVTAPTALVAE